MAIPKEPEGESNRKLVLQAWAHLAVGDMASFGDYLDEAVRWRVIGADFLPNHGEFIGKDRVMADFLSMAVWDYDQYKMEITNTYADGPHVVLEFFVNAKTKDGREYDNAEYVVVTEVRGARLIEVREYVDGAKARKALLG